MNVELLDYFGNDLMVVNAARVSYGKNKEVFDEKDEKLINFLVENKHTSVFRHPQLQFRVTCPIFCERQVQKHQVGLSMNSISGRYVDFSDSYYLIEQWRLQSKDSKQGSQGLLTPENNELANTIQHNVIETCKKAYQDLLDLGVAKEQARAILPLSLNTSFIWTGSLLAFLHFFKLRLKPDAQEETRNLAKMFLDEIVKTNDFNYTLKAFGLTGE
jgi:thymidylate synthase (FAD)